MDFFDGLVSSDNILSSLNIDAMDLSSCNSFGNHMWSNPSTHIQESDNIPFSSNSIPSTSSFGNEYDVLGHNSFDLHGGFVDNPSFDSMFHEPADFSTCYLHESQTNDDILQWVVDSRLDSDPLISGNGRSSDSTSYKTALAEHPMNYTKEEPLENMIMAPLVDNKNVIAVPKIGLFSQLGLDQLLSHKAGSSSFAAKFSNEEQLSSPKRRRTESHTADSKSCITSQRVEESLKGAKKRARPGESTRPRPKDRQMIQDRIKELREIIPNSAKCSIDSLLDRTIKHMLFMQGVKKYGDKLKQVDELKAKRGNDNGEISGSAAWAIEVGSQNPIVVEDLGPSGQMLIEMLCEEQGFFLEIADVIRSFGLTILKGVVEARDDKLWSHFIVEASENVTRMQVLMSLVQLLQDKSTTSPLKMKTLANKNRVIGNNSTSSLLNNYNLVW